MTDGTPDEDDEADVVINADGTVESSWHDSRPVSVAVLEALETSTGKDTRSFGPLNDIVNADALNNVFRATESGKRRGPGYITFRIEGHSATVHSDGSVVVAPHDN
ncbi:MAG: HalOD1 output domain-containing protein [Haloarculaceae archaeon]